MSPVSPMKNQNEQSYTYTHKWLEIFLNELEAISFQTALHYNSILLHEQAFKKPKKPLDKIFFEIKQTMVSCVQISVFFDGHIPELVMRIINRIDQKLNEIIDSIVKLLEDPNKCKCLLTFKEYKVVKMAKK